MFSTRLVSGIILVIIAFVTMYLGGPVLAVVSLLISLSAFKELTKALKVNEEEKGFNAPEWVGLAGTVCYYASVFFD